MQLYFITRGKTNEVDEFVDWLKTRHLPMKIRNPANNTETTGFLECQLRPIQLWEFVFPKENLDIVLNSLKLPSGNMSHVVNGKPTFNIDAKLWALRKLLQAQPIVKPAPKIDAATGKEIPPDVLFLPYDRIKDLNIVGVGIREDGDIVENIHERI